MKGIAHPLTPPPILPRMAFVSTNPPSYLKPVLLIVALLLLLGAGLYLASSELPTFKPLGP